MSTTLKAFHGKSSIKQKYVRRVVAHQKADRLIRGQGWDQDRDGVFRGCAVGCTLEVYKHSRYPIELGIPEWLARVEDTLFEGMSEKKSRTWPEVFLRSINVGANLETVRVPFLCKVLESCLRSLLVSDKASVGNTRRLELNELSRKAVVRMIAAIKGGDETEIANAREQAREARNSSYAAAAAAYAAYADAAAAYAAYAAADRPKARRLVYNRLANELLVLLKSVKRAR